MELISKLLVVCPLVFFAGFVDSIAGGGGIISLPAYYIAGAPPHMALGTNKFASTFGTTISVARFLKSGKVHIRSALAAAAFAIAGSRIGALIALRLSDVFLKYVLIVALPILAIFILTKKNFDDTKSAKNLYSQRKVLILSGITGLVIGCYDGFFGPGTGTFLILIFNSVIGLDLLTSSGNAKIVNLASNVAALFTFLLTGNIIFYLGVPAAICSISGNYLGSMLAIKNGSKVIRPVFVLVLALLIIKIALELL